MEEFENKEFTIKLHGYDILTFLGVVEYLSEHLKDIDCSDYCPNMDGNELLNECSVVEILKNLKEE